MTAKNTVCLWYDNDAEDAANFYASTFPDSRVTAVHKAPADYPSGKAGDVITVEFTVMGVPCIGLNGGKAFSHSEAFSFQVATDSQEETDRYWNAIVGNGGSESVCGWCKDKWGLSWQISPRVLTEAVASADRAVAKRAFEAMLQMGRIDIAAIEKAIKG
ncbi:MULTISPECIES: VOC family protein [Pseudomonas]|uniref:VOC family protein n=1 Tax=Pseudomonas TaxID=286 RepID=UPI00062442AC|nr:VOC family protein [Pseudomonas sp. CCOS 191]CRI56755.1 3-demethylubiquinone-9 3-methyltransferase [Pseudomonas sp. CCOS 191]